MLYQLSYFRMYVLAKVGGLPVSWDKVVLYQLSYFRMYVLAKVGGLPVSWGKVVLYQLSYFRNACERKTRLELATPTLARLCSTN